MELLVDDAQGNCTVALIAAQRYCVLHPTVIHPSICLCAGCSSLL